MLYLQAALLGIWSFLLDILQLTLYNAIILIGVGICSVLLFVVVVVSTVMNTHEYRKSPRKNDSEDKANKMILDQNGVIA